MTDTEADIASVSYKLLRRRSDQAVKELELDGLAYTEFLTRLQIRPEVQQKWWQDNRIRSWRDKNARDWLRKGDAVSLRSLSEKFLTAFGHQTWHNNRGWLFSTQELDGEVELWYKAPKERQAGDHDRFFDILEPMWKAMRKNLFEIKSGAVNDLTTDTESVTSINSRRSLESRMPRKSRRDSVGEQDWVPGIESAQPSPKPVPAPKAISPHVHSQPTSLHKPRPTVVIPQQPPTQPQKRPPPDAGRSEIRHPGKWTAGQTQEALLRIITDLQQVRMNSHEETFTRLFEQHMARLEEIDYVEGQQTSGGKQKSSEDFAEQPVDSEDESITTRNEDFDEARRSLIVKLKLPDTIQEDVMNIALKSAHKVLSQLARQTISDAEALRKSLSPNVKMLTSPTHLPSQPSVYQSMLLPPTIPETLTACITPYSIRYASNQPYVWLGAPVMPDSYVKFRDGVCLRANVPGGVKVESVKLVLSYAWNDNCRVIGCEEDWTWLILDIRDAAHRGVDKWRLKVCVVG